MSRFLLIKGSVARALCLLSLLTGCASTTIETSGTALKEPFCKPGAPALSTIVYWGTQWRPDQKEPSLREAAALRGIEDFLARPTCFSVVSVRRVQELPRDDELLQSARASSPVPERVVLIVVRELGPRLIIGLPVIVEGGTEVLIEVRGLDTRTSEAMVNARTLWRNGGPFVVKGVGTLDQDMSAALRATLLPGPAAQ